MLLIATLHLLALAHQDPAASQPSAESQPAAELEQQYFEQCDRDSNGWISFVEAQAALDLDRAEFKQYDKDRDGRVDRAEFGARYRETLERVGSFRPPKPPGKGEMPPKRTGAQLKSAYDRDLDGGLDPQEAKQCFDDYQQDPGVLVPLFNKLDADHNLRLEGAEIDALADAIAKILSPGLQLTLMPKRKTVEELYGKVEERERALGAPPEPPRIAGPVPFFARLDLDRNGYIDTADMGRLQQFAPLYLRAATMLAALDKDGDGRLSRAEFESSMGTWP